MKYTVKEVFHMKVVVVKSPRLLAPMLRMIFKIKKEPAE
jgi:hypothetical protein